MMKSFIRKLIVSNLVIKNVSKPVDSKFKNVHLAFILPLQSNFLYKILFKQHPNTTELISFSQILQSFSSKVLYTDYRYNKKIKSDLLIGFGESFFKSSKISRKSILYATGSSANFQNKCIEDEIIFLDNFKFPFNLNKFFREANTYSSRNENNAKLILGIGNNFTKKTFGKNKNKVILLPGIPLDTHVKSNYIINRCKILWVGSKGILHKGLHIACEFAKKLNLVLVVVGISRDEKPFAEFILNNSGCHYELHGYVSIPSSNWDKITNDLSFVLGVSISEGMSTSILTCIKTGLYPITVDRCGINFGPVISFKPRENLVERLINAFKNIIIKDDVTLLEEINNFQSKIYELNTSSQFHEIIKKTIENYD